MCLRSTDCPTKETPQPCQRRVLVIDDRRDSVLVLRRMLELEGHAVFLASTGEAGVDLAREIQADVILCDICLAGEMNGFQVATAIRSDPALNRTYLVAVSGYGEEECGQQARSAGFDNYMTKPVLKDKLDELVVKMPRF
jgi:two-component system CheB/CheR fusion protein